MNAHEEMLDRMRGANPLPDVDMINEGRLAEMTVRIEEARRADHTFPRPQAVVPVETRVRWLRPAVAFVVALLLAAGTIGIVTLVGGGEPDLAAELSTTTTSVPAAPETSATFVSPINRVLDLALAGSDEL